MRKNILIDTFTYSVLIIGLVVILGPFMIMISTAISPDDEIFSWPLKLIPSEIKFSNFQRMADSIDFGRYMLNSAIVTVVTTFVSFFFNSAAGYALAKLHFPFRKIIFIFILGTMMIPIQVTMIPIFVMFRGFPLVGGNNLFGVGGTGLLNTYLALMLPNMATTVGIYLLREFFRTVPNELLDAARVDGGSEFGIYFRICLPLAGPGLIVSSVFNFNNTWNDFLWPLIMTYSPEMRTIQLGISQFQGMYFTEWNLMMAATILASLPVLILYAFFQKRFVEGLAATGIKG